MNLVHDALVAERLLWRDHQGGRGKAPACAASDGEAARSLGQGAEPHAIAVVYLDPSNPAIGVGIELDRDVVRIIGSGALWHLDKAGGAANAERCGRRRYLHVAAMG
ncbi:MAG: hypothetical protein KGL62_16075, partial [Bradyrhizobium sp.]|nr:hypothetical protein [Bradyrhizobium sp.]